MPLPARTARHVRDPRHDTRRSQSPCPTSRRHSRAPTRESMPLPARTAHMNPRHDPSYPAAPLAHTAIVWLLPPTHLAPSFRAPTGIHAPPARHGHSRAPTRAPTAAVWLLHPPPCRHSRGCTGILAPHDEAPATNAPIPLPCLLKPVLSRSKGIPETPGAGAPARRPDLRVNVAKCRRMSHFFIPPLGECRILRVKNLTFLAKTRPYPPTMPFWPIPVHFAPVRPPPPRSGRMRRGNFVQRFPSAPGGASPPTPGPLPPPAGGTRRGAV